MAVDLASMPELAHDERAIVSSRIFRAPRKLVYEAFADPKQVVQWWGPHGFRATIHEMDLRAGGRWVMTLHGPDGVKYPNAMSFTEVVPYQRIRLELLGGREGAEPIRLNKTITWEDTPEGRSSPSASSSQAARSAIPMCANMAQSRVRATSSSALKLCFVPPCRKPTKARYTHERDGSAS